MVVPNFAHNSGVNDRFAFGTRAAMDVYMRRFDWLQSQYDRPHSPPEPWARGSSTVAPGVSKPYGWSGGRVGPGGWLGGRAAPVDALGNASETEALVCRYLIAARLRVGVTPICIVSCPSPFERRLPVPDRSTTPPRFCCADRCACELRAWPSPRLSTRLPVHSGSRTNAPHARHGTASRPPSLLVWSRRRETASGHALPS